MAAGQERTRDVSKERMERISALGFWAIGIAMWAVKGWWYVCAAVFALHFVELFVKGLAVGKRAGKPLAETVAMTLTFGYTWWLPLDRRIRETGE